ncbi:MAG: hypothetical protein JWO98_252 [Frankiales bacterium]|nr:hypothetical protein [Frankiales bacterium]
MGHGPHRPSGRTPARRRGSVRRTSSLDLLDAGGHGPLRLRGTARDLRTADSTGDEVLGAAELDVVVERAPRPVVSAVRARPALPGLDRLVGAPAMSGYRAALAEALPDEPSGAGPLHVLLDDVPGAVIISGYAWAVEPSAGRPPLTREPPADVCSGWRSDGTMMTGLRAQGSMPRLAGPPAPALVRADDPLAWHELPPLGPREMRRLRRTDVGLDPTHPGILVVDAMFRDSYVDSDGDESVVHEYGLAARIDRDALTVLRVVADPRVLPWQECPVAGASAGRVVGQRLPGLRTHVRNELIGTSTCTHLNDLLRSLDDVAVLARAL